MFDAVEGKEAIARVFSEAFETTTMICQPDVIREAGEVAILEWRDPQGLRGCGFLPVRANKIAVQRGYWDQLSFRRLHNIPMD